MSSIVATKVSKDLCFFSDTAYFEVSEKSGEVGRQPAGWLKTLGQAKTPHA